MTDHSPGTLLPDLPRRNASKYDFVKVGRTRSLACSLFSSCFWSEQGLVLPYHSPEPVLWSLYAIRGSVVVNL